MKTYHDILTDGGSNVAGQVQEQERKLRHRLDQIDYVVAVMSGKGGVGKSLLTVNLATALTETGWRVGIVDADINGASVVKMTGVARNPERTDDGIAPSVSHGGVQVMSIDLFLKEGIPVEWEAETQRSAFTWRGMVEVAAIREMLADTVWDGLDILLVDLPPGTDRLPNLLDLVPTLSCAVVVSVPSRASTYVVRKSILLARRHVDDRPIGLVENMTEFVCDACDTVHHLFQDPGSNELLSEDGVQLLGRIPFDPRLGEETDSGNPYLTMYPDRPAAGAIRATALELCNLLGKSKRAATVVGVATVEKATIENEVVEKAAVEKATIETATEENGPVKEVTVKEAT